MSNFQDKYDNYALALVAYSHGNNSKTMRKCLSKKLDPYKISYVKQSLYGKVDK